MHVAFSFLLKQYLNPDSYRDYFLPGHFLQRSPFLKFLQQSFFFLQQSAKTVKGQLF